MMLRGLLTLQVWLLLAGSMAAGGEADSPIPDPPTPGRFTASLQSGKFERKARIHIPAGYRPEAKPPLVLLLHGGGGSATHALEFDGWAAKSEKEGFVVVAPEGLGIVPGRPTDFKTNPAIWNSGQYHARSAIASIDDVAFVGKLLDEMKVKVPHDAARVFATGHSNGGGMTFRLAAESSERFAAVGMVAGRLAVEKPKPAKPLPTLYIVGTRDPLMPLEGGVVKSPWAGTWTNRSVAEQLAEWAGANGCEVDPKPLSDRDGVRTLHYPSKAKGPTLTVLYLEGHGHHWSGAKRSLPENVIGPIASKLDATDAIWKFFQTAAPAKK